MELFSANVLLWSQYKYIAFNIFSSIILIILYKVLIITGISNEKANELTIYKRHNMVPTRTSFFTSSAGKIKSVQEFKSKLFE